MSTWASRQRIVQRDLREKLIAEHRHMAHPLDDRPGCPTCFVNAAKTANEVASDLAAIFSGPETEIPSGFKR